jgi:transposase
VAAHSKRARHLGAHLLFIDESGLLLSPLVRRTLAPKGQTPILQHRAKDREKVSLIAALTISPRSHQLGLYFSSLCNDSFDSAAVAAFLRQVLRHLRGPVIVVWDRGPMHHGQSMRDLREQCSRLEIEYLPPYAPDLNPVEQLWSYLKWGRLSNYSVQDAAELDDLAHNELADISIDRKRLRSFWAASDLPTPRTLAA